jgi:hypothetical protein
MRNHWTSEINLELEVLLTRVLDSCNIEQNPMRNHWTSKINLELEMLLTRVLDSCNIEQNPMRNHWTSKIKLARKVPALWTPEIRAMTNDGR